MAEQYDVIVTDESLAGYLNDSDISVMALNVDRLRDISEEDGVGALLRDGGVFCFNLAAYADFFDYLKCDAGSPPFSRVFAPKENEISSGMPDQSSDVLRQALAQCDVLIVNENQVRQLTGRSDYDDGVDDLIEEFHIPLIILNMGASGSAAFSGNSKIFVPAANADEAGVKGTPEDGRIRPLASVLRYLLAQETERSKEFDIRELEKILTS